MMNRPSADSGETDRLNAFDQELTSLFEEYRSTSLFKRAPIKTPVEDMAQRLSEGRYLFRPCGVQCLPESMNRLALRLFEMFISHHGKDAGEFARIRDRCVEGDLDLSELLELTLSNQGADLVRIIRKQGIRLDLMTLFLIYLARPFRESAARMLTENADLSRWRYGYCPVCGHWPSLSHIGEKEGKRHLWCLHCGTVWPFKRLCCAFCLNEEYDSLEIVKPAGGEPYRAQICQKCRRYVKELRTDLAIDDVPFDTAYLATALLDEALAREGFIQELPLIVRYENPEGNELLMYRQQLGNCNGALAAKGDG